jgi:ketosteroid isomerase-like protein
LDEVTIRQRVDDLANAVRRKDTDLIVSFYAASIVSFDVGPPLRYVSIENKRRAWQEALAAYAGPINYDVRELDVTMDETIAVVHRLNHVHGKLTSGQVSDLWLRWAACFRQIDDVWLVVHDHVSVPVNLARGRAVSDFEP